MSVAVAIQHELKPHHIGSRSDDAGRPTAVEGEGHLVAAIQRPARVAPQHSEGAEALAAIGHIYPRRAAQLMPIVQAHGGATRNIAIHHLVLPSDRERNRETFALLQKGFAQ